MTSVRHFSHGGWQIFSSPTEKELNLRSWHEILCGGLVQCRGINVPLLQFHFAGTKLCYKHFKSFAQAPGSSLEKKRKKCTRHNEVQIYIEMGNKGILVHRSIGVLKCSNGVSVGGGFM
jgi:hypothetical protein